MNTALLEQFSELSTSELQTIVGGKHGWAYHVEDAIVSFGKGFLNAF